MAVIATHFLPGSKTLRPIFHREGLGHLDLAQRGATIIRTVAIRTGRGAGLCRILMPRYPALADGVQAVWAASGGQGHSLVACRAFIDGAGMALNRQALHIIVHV